MGMLPVNKKYFKSIVQKTRLTGKQFGKTIGQSENFTKNVLYRAKIHDYSAEMICRVYGADFKKLTTPEDEIQENRIPLYSDDKSVEALVNGILRMEKKIDILMKELGY